jgi:hypothetical protein
MKPLLLIAIVLGAGIQRERIITPSEQTADETRFFDQLRLIFGRFSNTDLQDAFRKAAPIRCSELVNNRGTWRTVAFFNQDSPALGSWFRSNLEDVKRDLDAYVFSGVCNGERGSLSLTTKFPVEESVEAFNQRRIGLEEVDVNVNAAVTAVFDFQTESYVFDLPYLFFKGVQNGMNVYSLHPPLLETRDRYARAVAAHFDCKAVRSADVTYQFLICRYTLRFPNESGNLPRRSDTAYYILSDGKEATSSVRLTFGGPNPLDQGAGAVSRTSTEAPTVARPGEGPLDDPQVRSRLNVNLAQVDALARDRNGRPISNLTVSDFRLFEDGVERPIQTFSQDQLPLAIALVIDRRASVASSLPEIQKSAHKALAQLKEADMACLFAFDTGVEMLEALTHDRQGVAKRIGSIS